MTKWDKYLIGFIIVVSLSGLYYAKTLVLNDGTSYVKVQVDGKDYKKISMGENVVGKTFDIKTEFGFNKLEIGEDKVRVIEADCPDELDVKQGWIDQPGQVLVCLPNRLVVTIESDEKKPLEVDDVSH